jgi:diaphanous 1
MKALFWANLPVNKIPGTIWEKLDDTKININKDSLELKFSQKSKTEKKPETKKEITKNKKLSLLQPDTIRKINIVLNKLKFSTTDIPDLIETMDTNKLTTNVCELLIQIMPTTEEVKLVTNYDGKEEISINDEMVIMISSIPGYTERLEAIIFDNSYESDCEIIEEEVDKFFKAFDFLKNSKKFKQWLKIIMAFGNYMNGGTFRGGVYAFKLNALNKLNNIKSRDNSKTLLLYINGNCKNSFDLLDKVISHD